MAKKAKLVTVSLTTRVIVDESATEGEILILSKSKLMEKIATQIGEHVESILEDAECPYDPEFDNND